MEQVGVVVIFGAYIWESVWFQVLAETPADCQVFHGFPHFVKTGAIYVTTASLRILPGSPVALTVESVQCMLPRAL